MGTSQSSPYGFFGVVLDQNGNAIGALSPSEGPLYFTTTGAPPTGTTSTTLPGLGIGSFLNSVALSCAGDGLTQQITVTDTGGLTAIYPFGKTNNATLPDCALGPTISSTTPTGSTHAMTTLAFTSTAQSGYTEIGVNQGGCAWMSTIPSIQLIQSVFGFNGYATDANGISGLVVGGTAGNTIAPLTVNGPTTSLISVVLSDPNGVGTGTGTVIPGQATLTEISWTLNGTASADTLIFSDSSHLTTAHQTSVIAPVNTSTATNSASTGTGTTFTITATAGTISVAYGTTVATVSLGSGTFQWINTALVPAVFAATVYGGTQHTSTATSTSSSSSSNSTYIIVGVVAAVIVVGLIIYLVERHKKKPPAV